MPTSRHRLLLCLVGLLALLATPTIVAAQAPDPNADLEEPWLEGYIPDDLPDDQIVGRDPNAQPPADDDVAAGDEQSGAEDGDGMLRTRRAMVPGRLAMLRPDGKAAIPRGAPKSVRRLIGAANQIVGKPYKRRGGHGRRLRDRGYDASGAVGYALIKARLQRKVVGSGRYKRMYRSKAGRHVTIYASRGHVYIEIAGLRLDTSTFGDKRKLKGVQWRPAIGKRRGFSVRHPFKL